MKPGGNEAGTHGQLELCHRGEAEAINRRLILGQPRLGSR